MSKYFARYLPVEGEIEKGDNYIDQVGNIGKAFKTANLYKNCKKVKLFLCSIDIQVGDKVYVGITRLPEPAQEVELPYLRQKAYKVIGEISPEAEWVKEGDEFEDYLVVNQYRTPLAKADVAVWLTDIPKVDSKGYLIIKKWIE